MYVHFEEQILCVESTVYPGQTIWLCAFIQSLLQQTLLTLRIIGRFGRDWFTGFSRLSTAFQTICKCFWIKFLSKKALLSGRLLLTFGVASDLTDLYEKVWSCIACASSSDSLALSEGSLQESSSAYQISLIWMVRWESCLICGRCALMTHLWSVWR